MIVKIRVNEKTITRSKSHQLPTPNLIEIEAEVLSGEAMIGVVYEMVDIEKLKNQNSWAESLIKQLPKTHDGRNTWLLAYGKSNEAKGIQALRVLKSNYSNDYKLEEVLKIFGVER